MNRIFSVAVILLSLAGFSCAKVCSEPDTDAGIVGKWTFTESLIDPGDGSGTWQAAPPNQSITFNADGTFTGEVGLFLDYTRYEVLNDSALKLIKADASFITLQYKLQGNGLDINPQCFERCGFKFARQ